MIRICPERDAQCLNGMACAEPCAGSSAETLKKVLLAICENKGRTSGDLADAILTALASGSGDHAELAAKAERCTTGDPWYKESDLRGRQTFEQFLPQDRAFIAAANPDTVLALLAEIAALRADGEVYQNQADHEFGLRKEAERKLAEAREWIGKLDCECDPAWSSRQCGRCTFLSKEAERG